ncbi:hypothetical protein [Hymenobacter sp. DG25B]|nr:hypothetical protein [Hymenobacter sp. DG25B]
MKRFLFVALLLVPGLRLAAQAPAAPLTWSRLLPRHWRSPP